MTVIRNLIGGGQCFFCPGCRSTHCLNSHPNGPKWVYNGDMEEPTFSPSVLVTLRWSENDDTMTDEVCHSFVTDGNIQFLNDCTHDLKGQTVALPPWPYLPGSYDGVEELQ